MRTLVFSKFFKSAVKVARCSGVAAYKRGIEIDFHPLHAFFDWPDGVTFDGCDLKVDSSIMAGVLEMSEAHGGFESIAGERLPVKETEDGCKSERPKPAMMHVKFQDGTRFDCEASVCGSEYDFLHDRARLDDEPTFAAVMDSAEFSRALKLVEPCVSKEENRPVLTTVHMDVRNGMLRFQSTDRFRMAVSCVRNATIERDGGDGFSCFTPVKIMRLFADKTIGNVRVECRDDYTGLGFTTFFGCELDGWNVVVLKTMNGEFPKLGHLWRYDGKNTLGCGFVCDVKQLKDVVAKLKISKSNALTFSIAKDGIAVANELGVSYQVTAIGCGTADPNAVDGRVLTVVLNAHMLGELLTRLAALGSSVEFLACNEVKPVWIGPVVDAERPFDVTGLGGEGYLLVPMRANGCHDDVPVQSVGGFKPCASKLDSVAGLVDVPDFDFGMTDTAKPRKPVERKPRKPRVRRKPVERVEPVQQPEQPEQPEPVKPETEPEPVASEPVPQPQQPMSELGGHTIVEFAHEFEAIYTMLHDSDVSPADYGDAVTAFADGEYPVNVLEAFNAYREDFVSSDREAAAFMMALQSRAMQPAGTVAAEAVEPEPVTAEIPEVPPQTEPHEVVATSSAVMVRKVVIPGGKSVRELADVFGGFRHKPRGFRDSKGRRVAYVAFDGTGGVIAYRDYYTDVDTRLEQDIADYLAAHNLKLAA